MSWSLFTHHQHWKYVGHLIHWQLWPGALHLCPGISLHLFPILYDGNIIIMESMQSHDDDEMTRVYTTLYAQLKWVSIKPKINIMDNKASWVIKTWLTKENMAYETVAPSDGGHQNNRAEQAIQTGSNHLVSIVHRFACWNALPCRLCDLTPDHVGFVLDDVLEML